MHRDIDTETIDIDTGRRRCNGHVNFLLYQELFCRKTTFSFCKIFRTFPRPRQYSLLVMFRRGGASTSTAPTSGYCTWWLRLASANARVTHSSRHPGCSAWPNPNRGQNKKTSRGTNRPSHDGAPRVSRRRSACLRATAASRTTCV